MKNICLIFLVIKRVKHDKYQAAIVNMKISQCTLLCKIG